MKILSPQLQFGIRSWGAAFPGTLVSNADLIASRADAEHLSVNVREALDRRIVEAFGYKTRYLAHWPGQPFQDDEANSESLATAAVASTLRNLRDVEAFVLGSTTSRRYSGSQASAVLGHFGINAPAYEMKIGCSTSLASLQFAYSLLTYGYDNLLVACAETMSKLIDPDIRESWFGLADGAAAIWLDKHEKKNRFEVKKTCFSTDGDLVDIYTTRADLPPTAERAAQGGYFLRGDATQMRVHAKKYYMQMLNAILPTAADRERIRWIIAHQVSRSLIDEVLSEANLRGHLIWDADRVGNIGGASVLYSLCNALESQPFVSGDEVLLMSVGGGLSYAAQIWKKISYD